jgi:hypothetical protein
VNFLQIVARAITECGASGTSISTTANQSGEQQRFVNWVNAAWGEIQTKHDDWGWMRSSNLLNPGVTGMQFNTVAGQANYQLGTAAGTCGVAVANFGKWDREAFRNYTTAAGTNNEMFMDIIPYDTWRDSYMLGAMRAVQTRPVAIAIGPDNSICLGPPPNSLYTITGDYFVAATSMVQDTDVPTGLEVAFHLMIVYRTMMFYGSYESAPEVFARGSAAYDEMMDQLEAKRLPIMTFGGSL